MEDKNRSPLTRKSFLKKAGLGAAAFWSIPFSSVKAGKNQFVLEREYDLNRKYAANDLVNIASIGVGGMGQSNTTRSLSVPGTKLVAACDLYDSRLLRCKEIYGDDIFTTRNYHEILDRDDVDAVIVSTSDHWHQRIAIDALNKGIGVYLEKPMVKDVSEGYDLIEAEKIALHLYWLGVKEQAPFFMKRQMNYWLMVKLGILTLLKLIGEGALQWGHGTTLFLQVHPRKM